MVRGRIVLIDRKVKRLIGISEEIKTKEVMKTTLILTGVLIVATGCGTAQKSTRQARDHPVYSEQRVEGQWAREAGMHEREWTIGKVATPATTEMPALAQGGAAQAGQEVTITTGSAGLEVLDQAEIDLRKEELVVGKRQVSNGGVLVRTIIQTEEVKQPIDLRREEYVIERIPAGSARDQQARAEAAFQGREIYIPLMREEPISGKRTVLTEAIKIGKRVETDQQTVSMPVRTEDVQIVKNPNLTDPKFAAVPRRAASAGMTVPSGAPVVATTDTLKLAREELMVGKQERDNGGVYLQKVIRTETASQPVELRREEYTVERNALAGELASTDFTPRQIQLGLSREEAVAGTRNYVAETVRVRKQMLTDQQIVSGTVRKESAEVVRLSESAVIGQGGTAVQSAVTTITESDTGCCAGMTKDEFLAQHVEKALMKGDATTPAYSNIKVTTENGVVTLRGDVDSAAEKKLIGKRVKSLSGVRSVNNELRVMQP